MARTLRQLIFAGETPNSIRRSLADHYTRKNEFAGSSDSAQRWIDISSELFDELNILTAEGHPP